VKEKILTKLIINLLKQLIIGIFVIIIYCELSDGITVIDIKSIGLRLEDGA